MIRGAIFGPKLLELRFGRLRVTVSDLLEPVVEIKQVFQPKVEHSYDHGYPHT